MDTTCTCPDTRPQPDIARAMARVDALHRTIGMSSKPNHNSIFHGSEPKPSGITLGKFNATTATSRWPDLGPSSKLRASPTCRNREDIFASSHPTSRSEASDSSSSSGGSPCPSPTEFTPPTKRPRFTVDSDSRRRRIQELVMPLESVFPLSPKEGSERMNRSINLQQSEQTLPGIRSLLDVRKRPSSSSVFPVSRRGVASQQPKLPLPRIRTDLPPGEVLLSRPTQDLSEDDRNWMHYADQVSTERGGTKEWRCLWREQANGISASCGYIAKKQLMKRHVETTHLKMKPFVCPYCDCRFPQKTSLNVHTASKHTRDNPYKCPFEGCVKAFNDPARLHRHKTDAHGYVPKLTIRCKRDSSSSRIDSVAYDTRIF